MKRILILFVFASIAGSIWSQENVNLGSDSTANRILNELRIIRGIQEKSENRRTQAVKERLKRDNNQNPSGHEILASDYGQMARIGDNTEKDWRYDGWNLFGIITFLIASGSLTAAIITFLSQRKTEKNTKKLSQDMQRCLLNELLRHLYRNYVILYSIRTKLDDVDFKGYPSEEHFKKFKIPLNNIHLDSFYGKDREFRLMHILYLNLRNYNEEIDVAEQHFLNPAISRDVKVEDLDTLEFKIYYLTERIVDTIRNIWGEEVKTPDMDKKTFRLTDRLIREIKDALKISLDGKTNASENIEVEGWDKFTPMTEERLAKTYSLIYSPEELKQVTHIFNHDVGEERKNNSRDTRKIRILPY